MELASMLSGESFSDRPRCVCRVIGAFLRGYNDLLDDERRQDLYEYAAKVVGTAGSAEIERARAERLRQWGDELLERRPWALTAHLRRLFRRPSSGSTGEAAARAALVALGRVGDQTHAEALALIDELISLGRAEPPASKPRVKAARMAAHEQCAA
jgi:hypothetical protein